MNRLPRDWVSTTFGEICERPQYGWTTKADPGGSGLKLVRTTDITRGPINWSTVPYCSEDPADVAKYLIHAGDILVSRSGSVGASALVEAPDRAVFASYLIRFRAVAGVLPRYLGWFLKSPDYWRQISDAAAGIALRNVNAKKLASLAIPLPPRDEQPRIVEAIEEQLSRLDDAERLLATVRQRLKTLRTSALSAEIRNSWPMKPLGEIASTSSGGTPSRRRPDYFGGPIPWVKSGELRDGLVTATQETITETALMESSAKVVPRGTLLVALYGATVGKLGILGMDAAATNQAVCAVQPHEPEMTPYLWHVLRSKRASLISAGQGGAQSNISQTILRELPVPMPPPVERERIVAEVDRYLSIADATEAAIHTAFRRSATLRRAILDQAFRGTLVPQDPSAEPASVLLERIAEKRAADQPKRARKRVARGVRKR